MTGIYFLILYMIPTYRDILLRTVLMCRVQFSDSSIMTPRNLVPLSCSIAVFSIIEGGGRSIFFVLKKIMYFVILRFYARPLDFTHFTRFLINMACWQEIASIVSLVKIRFASSAI